MFKHWNFHFALVLNFCWKNIFKSSPKSFSNCFIQNREIFATYQSTRKSSTEEERNKTSCNITGCSFCQYCWGQGKVAGSIYWQRPKVCCGNTSYLYVQSPRKIHEDQSHFYHMEQHTCREIPVLLRPESRPLTCCHNMIQR